MAVPRNHALVLALALVTAGGCRGTPQPEPVSRATPPPAKTAPAAPAASDLAPAASKPSPGAPVKEVPPARDDDAVVVDPGVDDSEAPKTLAEAAQAERERRSRSGKPVAVITDKTLPQYARKGQITIADPKEKEKKDGQVAPIAEPEPVRDEQYWRSRAMDIRLRLRQTADEVKELEQRSTELRQRYYSETDSFLRDNQIKPEWDRVLDRLRQGKGEIESTRQELARFLDEGGAAGAQPGWLREGEELEPEVEKQPEKLPAPQSVEPPVLNDNRDNGGRSGK